jgi:hypothetical protein
LDERRAAEADPETRQVTELPRRQPIEARELRYRNRSDEDRTGGQVRQNITQARTVERRSPVVDEQGDAPLGLMRDHDRGAVGARVHPKRLDRQPVAARRHFVRGVAVAMA